MIRIGFGAKDAHSRESRKRMIRIDKFWLHNWVAIILKIPATDNENSVISGNRPVCHLFSDPGFGIVFLWPKEISSDQK